MTSKKNRKTPRRKVRIPVFAWDASDEKKEGEGKTLVTRDLSANGIGFYSNDISTVGTVLNVDMYFPKKETPVSCQIKITFVKALTQSSKYILGAFFVDLSAEDKEFIVMSLKGMDLYLLLESMLKGGASDLHLTVGRPPMVRRDGKILEMAAEPLEEGQIEAMLYPLLTDEQISLFEQVREMDFAFSPDVSSRFRVNMHWQKGFVEAAIRNIPTKIASFQELGLPEKQLEDFCSEQAGLLLIAGTTGSGKTTTLSSIVNFINNNYKKVIITVEDPIEYTFKSNNSIIKQRELGSDTRSYAEALKRGLRQDPDILCVGEILDGECLSAALRAAETGHLVISTVHAPNAISAIERCVNFFPPEHSASICQQISSCLSSILFQVLIPRKDQKGRLLATELLLNNHAVKNLIREGRFSMMPNVMQTGRNVGMYTIENSLEEFYKKGLIEESVMLDYINQDYTQKL